MGLFRSDRLTSGSNCRDQDAESSGRRVGRSCDGFAIERREPLSHQAVERPPLARGLFRDLPLADADEGPERERGDEVEQEQQRK
jgi:hypothetical protein